jgi:hypothetical protein
VGAMIFPPPPYFVFFDACVLNYYLNLVFKGNSFFFLSSVQNVILPCAFAISNVLCTLTQTESRRMCVSLSVNHHRETHIRRLTQNKRKNQTNTENKKTPINYQKYQQNRQGYLRGLWMQTHLFIPQSLNFRHVREKC